MFTRAMWIRWALLGIAVLLLLFWLLFGKGFDFLTGDLLQPALSCAGSAEDCAAAQKTIGALPGNCKKYVRSLTIGAGEAGLAGFTDTYGNVRIPKGRTANETRDTLVHECGHVVDFFGFRGSPRSSSTVFTVRTLPTFSDDPSLEFYALSWAGPAEKLTSAKNTHFVSEYARLNTIEDFAETYVEFVLQPKRFAQRAKLEPVLQRKFDVMQRLLQVTPDISKGDGWTGISPPVVEGPR